MNASWVAGTVRARALTRRRVGAAGARSLAACATLSEAASFLAATPYAHDAPVEPTLPDLQRAVGATLLWHMRVLAGWLPREGADAMRRLVGGFETANVEELVARLRGVPHDPAYRLGALETAWSRLEPATSLDEVRQVLATSRWGDPGSSTPWSIGVAMRLAWADRVAAGIDEAVPWARAAATLLLVREVAVRGQILDDSLRLRASSLLGPAFVERLSPGAELSGLAPLLPGDSRWVLAGVVAPTDLWRAEAAWRRRVERDGFSLLHRSGFGRGVVVGAAAVLAADAWRVRAALETAARGGTGEALEVFDAVA